MPVARCSARGVVKRASAPSGFARGTTNTVVASSSALIFASLAYPSASARACCSATALANTRGPSRFATSRIAGRAWSSFAPAPAMRSASIARPPRDVPSFESCTRSACASAIAFISAERCA